MNKAGNILGVRVDFMSKESLLEKVDAVCSSNLPGGLLSTTNPEFVLTAQKDAEFMEILNNSFLSVPDGAGVLAAQHYLEFLRRNPDFKSRLLGFPRLVTELFRLSLGFERDDLVRLSGTDLIYDLCGLAEEKGYTVFLLGGWPTDYLGRPLSNPDFDIAQMTQQALRERFPRLKCVGATSQFSPRAEDDELTLSYIQEAMASAGVHDIDIVLVCYGHPAQEKWINRNLGLIPGKVGIGLGGTFDYVSGYKKPVPGFISKLYLNWLHRMITQPWRLGRVLKSLVIFPALVLTSNRDK